MTRTGTVVCVRESPDAVTIALTVTNAELVDLFAGLASVDILGGFGAWRTMMPNALAPARIAGQFTLRRTYADPTEPTAAQETPAGAREDSADAGVPGEQTGRGGGGAERGEAEQPNGAISADGLSPVSVPESARESLKCCDCGDTIWFNATPWVSVVRCLKCAQEYERSIRINSRGVRNGCECALCAQGATDA